MPPPHSRVCIGITSGCNIAFPSLARADELVKSLSSPCALRGFLTMHLARTREARLVDKQGIRLEGGQRRMPCFPATTSISGNQGDGTSSHQQSRASLPPLGEPRDRSQCAFITFTFKDKRPNGEGGGGGGASHGNGLLARVLTTNSHK